ncbi:MAG: penicillin-binding transpeptidase domain-containing protein [Bacillota bacterium]
MKRFSSVIQTQKRLLAIFFAVAFLFVLLLGRLGYVSLVKMSEYQTMALSQWTRDVPNEAVRGDILDRNGIVLATTNTTYDLYSRNNMITEKQQTAISLANYIDVSYEELYVQLSKNVSEVCIASGLSKEEMEKLQNSGIDGLYFSVSWERVYPYGDLLCQTIGYVGTDGSGQSGLELLYDEYLSGTDGKIYTQTDIVGVEVEGEQYVTAAIDGMDIVLTIDVEIQMILENALKTAAVSSNPESISGIIMDPETFEVLAIANYPTFDLNDVPRDDISYLNEISRNLAIVDVYEPGSTFKIITAAMNVEEYSLGNENAFSTDYIFSSSPTRNVGGTTVKCWDKHLNGKHSNLNLQGALENSCNPIFVDIALSLGTETFYDYLEAFGLTTKTGIDFIGEANSILIAQENVQDHDLARIGFGQTVAVTKIQLLSAVSGAINGGYIYEPTLLKEVTTGGMLVFKNTSELVSNPISEDTSEYIRTALQGVVESGSGKKAMVAGEIVGGKTGTAQKYENGVIASGKYVSSFVGYLGDPARYSILITVDEPEGIYYGSQVCAPIASEVFTQIAILEDLQEM